MRLSYILILALFTSCSSNDRTKGDEKATSYIPTLMKGQWVLCYNLGKEFMQMELTDGAYAFITSHDYIGPLRPITYTLQGDSLILNEPSFGFGGGRGRWKINKADSLSMQLTANGDTLNMHRQNFKLPLYEYSYPQDYDKYAEQFEDLRKKFNCR